MHDNKSAREKSKFIHIKTKKKIKKLPRIKNYRGY
ncbi:hypothetical protein EV143_104290 [Flavobacterium chryseum]|nr:hypothetical protein EV143_104290 [Flavobacterium sp. P3160]